MSIRFSRIISSISVLCSYFKKSKPQLKPYISQYKPLYPICNISPKSLIMAREFAAYSRSIEPNRYILILKNSDHRNILLELQIDIHNSIEFNNLVILSVTASDKKIQKLSKYSWFVKVSKPEKLKTD